MKRLLQILAVAFLSGMATTAAASAACAVPQHANVLAGEIAAGVNANRRARGLPALQYNPTLGQAAMTHACDMAVRGFFSHSGSDGSTVRHRVRAQGYRDCMVAENLGQGYPTAGQIISGWMNSADHRSNMLHPQAREMGIGVTQGARGPNWVLVLAKGC